MAGIYGSLARGIESGFGMAQRAAEFDETKRSRQVLETRQAEADARAQETHDLTTQRLKTQIDEHQDNQTYGIVQGRLTEIERQANAAQRAGGEIPPALAEEHGRLTGIMTDRAKRAAARLSPAAQTGDAPPTAEAAAAGTGGNSGTATVVQQAKDFWSRAATGQINPLETSGPELRMHLSAATGVKIDELPTVVDGVRDVQTGLQTGNTGMVVSGMNKAMIGRLRIGIGGPSPYGGQITRKEIIGLDPAVDANGQQHPNRFIPRMRVYVGGVSPTGEELYYDAPMTRKGSTDKDDPVVAIDINKGLEWAGNVTMLGSLLQHPEIAAKVAQNDGGRSDQFVESMRNLQALTAERPQRFTTRDGRVGFAYSDGSVRMADEVPAAAPKPPTPLQESQTRANNARAAVNEKRADGTLPAPPKAKGAGGGAGGGASLTDDAVDQQARAALQDRSVLNSRAIPKGDMPRVLNRMAELGKGNDLGLSRADYRAAATTLNKMLPQYHAVTAFENNAIAQGKVLMGLADKVDTTGVPVIERWVRAGRKAIAGDPDVSAFHTQLYAFRAEAARILTNPNLTGVLTVYAQKEVEHFLPENASAAQVKRVVGLLENDFALRKRTLEQQMDSVRQDLVKGSQGGAGAPAPAPGAAPAAAPAPAGGMPQRPAGVPSTAKYSPSRQEWWDNGQKVWPR